MYVWDFCSVVWVLRLVYLRHLGRFQCWVHGSFSLPVLSDGPGHSVHVHSTARSPLSGIPIRATPAAAVSPMQVPTPNLHWKYVLLIICAINWEMMACLFSSCRDPTSRHRQKHWKKGFIVQNSRISGVRSSEMWQLEQQRVIKTKLERWAKYECGSFGTKEKHGGLLIVCSSCLLLH